MPAPLQFVHPLRVGQKLAAHGGALDAPGSKLLLHEIGVVQAAHAAEGQAGVLPHSIAELEEAARLAEGRVAGGRDGVFQCRVVGQRDMEAGHARLFQQRHKDGQFFHQNACVAVVGVFLPDSQLVVNGKFRHGGMDGPDRFHGKAGAVLGAAAVFIGAVIEDGRAEAAAHPVAVHLHHVEPSLFCQHRRLAEACEDGLDLPLRHFGDVRLHFGVQLFAQLVRGELFGQHGGDVFEHRQHVGIALVQLGADLAIRLVGDLHDLLIKREAPLHRRGIFRTCSSPPAHPR